jgi:hypothetical protein
MKSKFAFLLIFSFFFACKSAQDKFKDKNYIGAFEDALKDLKKGKDKKENLLVLKKSITKLSSAYKSSFDKLTSASSLDAKAKVADSNIDLLDRFERSKNFLIADSFFNQSTLLSQNSSLRQEVGLAFKSKGSTGLNELKSTNRKLIAPMALSDIEKAAYYLNEDLQAMTSDIYKYGTVLINFEVETWGNSFNNFEVDRIFRNIEDYNSNNKLQKIYYDANLPQNQLDCNVELRLSSPDYNEYSDSRTLNFSEKVEDGYDIVKDKDGKETKVIRYKNIQGQVLVNSIILKASCNAETNINSYNGNCSWMEERWTRSVETRREEYRLSGDLRAIPSQYKNQPSNNNTKSRSQLSDELLRDVYNVVVNQYF